MARDPIELRVISIDSAKEQYINVEKGVDYSDILEVLGNAPRFIRSFSERGDERFAMLGPNAEGRYLLTAIAFVDGEEWRVVSAYWLRSNRGKRLYEEGL